jgi:hypothetical protein
MRWAVKGDMKTIDVRTGKAERAALRFENETSSVLRLVPRGRDYALYENENLLAIFLYRKGAANVARLLVQAWPSRYGRAKAVGWKEMAA